MRFFGALWPAGPSPAAEQWAGGYLSPAERALFDAMSGPDRRHAIGVAREALELAAGEGRTPAELPASFVTAALLHDVGKNDAGLGTFARVWTTMAAVAVGRDRIIGGPAEAASPGVDDRPPAVHIRTGTARRSGVMARHRRRMASYLQHDQIGAELLAHAGSDDLTVAWAREHHLPESRWSVDDRIGAVLEACRRRLKPSQTKG